MIHDSTTCTVFINVLLNRESQLSIKVNVKIHLIPRKVMSAVSTVYNILPCVDLEMSLDITLSPSITTEVPYANNLDPDETPSNSAPHPNPNLRCLTLKQHFTNF